MKPDDELKFSLTTDPEIKDSCAAIMSRTDPWITLGMDFAQCRPAFEGECKEIWIAESGNELAGFVIMQTGGTFSGYIQTICIAEGFRGKGIGTSLLEFCEKRILKYSPNVFICVSSFNQGAARLYYKFGFELIGELENFVKEGFTELLLRKTVGPRSGYTGQK